MGKVTYNKAVRDKIPDIISESGSTCTVKKLYDKEFLKELDKKLLEEVMEYQKSGSHEELADILEVVYRIAELRHLGKYELESIRRQKRSKRGGFSKNLFLVSTFEK